MTTDRQQRWNNWPRNFDLDTYIARTLTSEGSLEILLKKLGVIWDIIGISVVKRTEQEFIAMKNVNIFYYRRQKDKKKHGVSFLVNKERTSRKY